MVGTRSTDVEGGPDRLRRFAFTPNHTLTGGEVFAENAAKRFDGIRLSREGRLCCAAEHGAHRGTIDETLIGTLKLPERAANLSFGPPGWNVVDGHDVVLPRAGQRAAALNAPGRPLTLTP